MNEYEQDNDSSPVLLFDDECGLCNSAVQTVLRFDPEGTLRFASLNGHWGLALRERHPELNEIDSMVWYLPKTAYSPEIIDVRSRAAILTAQYLGGVFSLAMLGMLIPRPIRDAGYDFIARHRHHLLGTPTQCLIPTPEQRGRFLD